MGLGLTKKLRVPDQVDVIEGECREVTDDQEPPLEIEFTEVQDDARKAD